MTTAPVNPSSPSGSADAARQPARVRSRQPTVCQVLHSLNIGGAEVLAARIAGQLSERFRFVFACLDDTGPLGEELREQGFQVEHLTRQPGFDFGCARRLSRLCRDAEVDLLHAHQYTPFSYAIASGILRRRPPILFTEHGRWYPDYPRRKRILFNRLLLRKRDRVVGVGESVRQALIHNEGIPAERVGVIYNGADLATFAAPPADQAAVRREIGVNADDFVMIQVARLDGLKDHATAIRTLERVVRERPQVRLVLVGEGPEQELIDREVRARRLEPYIRMLGLRKDVPRLLAAADLFLLTSVSEGIPVTFIEAMARRLPIVSTDVGGVGEVVLDGETGLLAPSGDDAGLAQAVIRLVDDAELRHQFGAAGRARAEAMFSEAQMHAAYARLYEEMLGER